MTDDRVSPAPPARLILHIGQPKTGTTALQTFLHDNREALIERGIFYPRHLARRENGHYGFAHKLAGTPQGQRLKRTVEGLEEEIAEAAAPVTIISSESFSSHASVHPIAPKLHRFADRLGLEPIILIWLRDQASYVQSLYTQRVKTGFTIESFDHYVAKFRTIPHLDFERLLAPWEAEFGDIRVRLYPPEGATMTEEFFAAAGIDIEAPALPHPLDRTNERPSARSVDYMRRFHLLLNQLGVDDPRRRGLLGRFRDNLAKDEQDHSGDFRPLSEIMARCIAAHFADGNRAVAERYFGREQLFAENGPRGPVNVFHGTETDPGFARAVTELLLTTRLGVPRVRKPAPGQLD